MIEWKGLKSDISDMIKPMGSSEFECLALTFNLDDGKNGTCFWSTKREMTKYSLM